jgi:predicted negative regulator of RcsB-dependent stress response
MKNFLFLLLFISCAGTLKAQDAADLIQDGVSLHEKGDYKAAIAKFDAAIALRPPNDEAMYEKSFSLIGLKRYDEAIAVLKKVLDISKDARIRRLAYVNYGTVLDYQGQKKESIKLYSKGIREFPDSYLLHFNKGITEVGLNLPEDAIASFKSSVALNPMHASSHNALGRMISDKSRIQAVLSIFTFLLVEPEGKRAEENVKLLNSLIMKGVSQKDEKNITISLDMGSAGKKKSKDDDFSSAEVMLSLLAARTPDSLVNKSEADKLNHRMETLIAVIDETNKKDKGFYKNFYVPFLIGLKNSGQLQTACYIALTASGKEDIFKWQNENKQQIEDFFKWRNEYKWPKL